MIHESRARGVIYLLRKSIIERFPDRKTDLRDRLIQLASEKGEEVIKRVENEFTQLY